MTVAHGPADPRWHTLGRCGSTNDEALRLGRAGAPSGTVVIAAAQDRGRGRQGHRWHSPPGENLYLSLLLRPRLQPAQAPLLTLCAGVATAEAVAEVVGGAAEVELKWPNDVLLRDKGGVARKVAGVLTELVADGPRLDFLVVGIGVNLNSAAFPPDLAALAVSVFMCNGNYILPADFAPVLLTRFDRWYGAYLGEGAGPVLARFSDFAAFLRRGEPIAVRGAEAPLVGTPAGLAADGALLLRDRGGTLHRVLAGEVVL